MYFWPLTPMDILQKSDVFGLKWRHNCQISLKKVFLKSTGSDGLKEVLYDILWEWKIIWPLKKGSKFHWTSKIVCGTPKYIFLESFINASSISLEISMLKLPGYILRWVGDCRKISTKQNKGVKSDFAIFSSLQRP